MAKTDRQFPSFWTASLSLSELSVQTDARKRAVPAALLVLAGFSALFIQGLFFWGTQKASPNPLPNIAATHPLVFAMFLSLIALFVVHFISPYRFWMFLVASSVPFETSTAVSWLPRLSPMDYFAAIGLVVIVFKELFGKQPLLFKRQPWYFKTLICWSIFFVYGFVLCVHTHGEMKVVLRWGEFLYAYTLGVLVMEEDGESPFQILGTVLAFLGSSISVISLAQFILGHGNAANITGGFGQRNIMAAFLSFCLPITLQLFYMVEEKQKIIFGTASMLCLVGLIVSYSRGAWMGLLVATGFVLIINQPVRSRLKSSSRLRTILVFFIFVLTLAVTAVAVRFQGRSLFSASQRDMYWQTGKQMLYQSPVVGIGPGNYLRMLPGFLSKQNFAFYKKELKYKLRIDFWQHLHNAYLQLAVDYGLAGLLIWLSSMSSLCVGAFSSMRSSKNTLRLAMQMSLIAFLIHNSVDILFVNSLDWLFALMTAGCTLFVRRSASFKP